MLCLWAYNSRSNSNKANKDNFKFLLSLLLDILIMNRMNVLYLNVFVLNSISHYFNSSIPSWQGTKKLPSLSITESLYLLPGSK